MAARRTTRTQAMRRAVPHIPRSGHLPPVPFVRTAVHRREGSAGMDVFVERLLIELLAIVAQLAIVRLVVWLRARLARADGPEAGGAVLAAA